MRLPRVASVSRASGAPTGAVARLPSSSRRAPGSAGDSRARSLQRLGRMIDVACVALGMLIGCGIVAAALGWAR